MPLANNNAGADGARPNEHRHGHRTGEVFRLALQNFDSPWTMENKLESDKEKDHAAEYLKRGKFRLHNAGENGIAKCSELTEK